MMKGIPCIFFALALMVMPGAYPANAQSQTENPLNRYVAPEDFTDVQGLGDSPEDFEYVPGSGASPRSAGSARVTAAAKQQEKARQASHDHEYSDSNDMGHTHGLTPETFQELSIIAQGGDKNALVAVGDAYSAGNGVQKDELKALEWYKRAAEAGATDAYSKIGNLYRDYGGQQEGGGILSGITSKLKSAISGDGATVEKNNLTAAEWYQRGVEAKDAQSFLQLGVMYRDGAGVPKNMGKANDLYNAGLAIRKNIQEEYQKSEQTSIRGDAERSETVSPGGTGAIAASGTSVTIDGVKCGISLSSQRSADFISVYDANCPGLTAANTRQKVVNEVAGLTCQVQYTGDTATHRLFCSSTKPDIIIADAGCRLQAVNAPQGYAAAYNAFCTGSPNAGVKTVQHLSMNCEVSAGTGQQTYSLRCKVAAASQTRSVKLGKHTCALQPVPSPSEVYNVYYEAYCGGLSEADKKAEDLPKTLTIEKNNCALTAWPTNPQKKDFEIGCI